jgi:hypothetical protein
MASGALARAGDRVWRPAAWLAGTLMAGCIALAFAHGRPWELRAPVLELRELPGAPVAVPVPRGLEMTAQRNALLFGSLRRDPLVVGCTLTRVDPLQPSPPGAAPRTQRARGLVSEAWSITHQGLELRLEVVRFEDAPGPWAEVPRQIARGVVFRTEGPGATAPAPSAPGPPPSPADPAAPPPR